MIRAIVLAALLLSACTTTKKVADRTFKPPDRPFTIVVFRPDIEAGQMTAGGLFEVRADWTQSAELNIAAALTAREAKRGGTLSIYADSTAEPPLRAQISEIVRLHRTVGMAVLRHKYSGAELPTKKRIFDWTLGPGTAPLVAATHADYALFVYARDSFSSGGRRALQVLGYAGCIVLACVAVPGGRLTAFASLVDLKTGQLVWFNVLGASVGDMRSKKGAARMVANLLDTFPEQPKPPPPAP